MVGAIKFGIPNHTTQWARWLLTWSIFHKYYHENVSCCIKQDICVRWLRGTDCMFRRNETAAVPRNTAFLRYINLQPPSLHRYGLMLRTRANGEPCALTLTGNTSVWYASLMSSKAQSGANCAYGGADTMLQITCNR